MQPLTTTAVPPPRFARRRRFLILILLLGFVGCALVGGTSYWLLEKSNREIQEAMAEADRLDPGWQLEDLEAAREAVSQSDNSAFHVLAAHALIPAAWKNQMFPYPSGGLGESLEVLSPEMALNEKQRQGLAAELQQIAEALQEAKKVAGMPRGRYAVQLAKDGLSTAMPHVDAGRLLAHLLRYDATVRAETGDFAGALESVRATIYLGRSFGDEPSAMAQFTRLFCSRQAILALERILVRSEPAVTDLEALQHLLEEEAAHPAQLISARVERAVIQRFLIVAENREIDRVNWGLAASAFGYRIDNFVDMMKAKKGHAKYLHFLTAAVEIAKLPAHEQESKFAELGARPDQLPRLLEGMIPSKEAERMRRIMHNSTTHLGSAVVALAAERFRRVEGRWPKDFNELAPKYLSSLPIDPFEGKPLQWIRTNGSSGPYWTIRAANLVPEDPISPAQFRLWDVKDRRK